MRPVHYRAAGRGTLAFGCYIAELREWLESRVTRHQIPRPKGTTDLSKVTCRECWRHIRRMAREREVT